MKARDVLPGADRRCSFWCGLMVLTTGSVVNQQAGRVESGRYIPGQGVAGLVLLAGGMLSAAVFCYFFDNYTLTGQRQFTHSAYVVIYYVLPLTVAGFLFASLRFAPARKVNLSLLLASSCASVYALERLMEWRGSAHFAATRPVMSVLADSTDRKKDAAALSKQWGVEVDPRTPDDVIASLRTGGVDPVPIMTPRNHLLSIQPDGSVKSRIRIDGQEVMPLAAVSNRLTLLCNEEGQWIHYQSDGHGFNNSNDIWQRDRLEIAALGDSFTQGYCVPPERNFVALIRQRHPATLNLGIAGDGPLMMLATFKEYLPRFRPQIVLWFYFEGNDLSDLVNERKTLLSNYLTDGFTQSGLARQNDIDQAIITEMPRLRALEETNRARRLHHPVDAMINFAKLSALREQLGLVGGISSDDAVAVQGANMEIFRQILSQASAQVKAWGGQFVFVYLPDWTRYVGYTPPEVMKHSDVLGVVHALGIPAVDVDVAFKAHGDPLSLFPFRWAAHYNEIGHRVVAEAVLKALSRGGPLQ